ncbi:hypothetical protein M3J09_002129 [Ascochyta lentis]
MIFFNLADARVAAQTDEALLSFVAQGTLRVNASRGLLRLPSRDDLEIIELLDRLLARYLGNLYEFLSQRAQVLCSPALEITLLCRLPHHDTL